MIHRKFLPENQNKHRYVNLAKPHNPNCCTSLSAEKGEDGNIHRNMDM